MARKGMVLSGNHVVQAAKSRVMKEKFGPGRLAGSVPSGDKSHVKTSKVQRGKRGSNGASASSSSSGNSGKGGGK